LRTKDERDNYVEYFEMLEKLKNAYSGGGQQPQRQEGHVNEDPNGAKPGLDS